MGTLLNAQNSTRVYEVVRESGKFAFPDCDYIALRNDTILFIDSYQYYYTDKPKYTLLGIASITSSQGDFYEIYTIGGSRIAVYEDMEVEEVDVPAEKDKKIIISMPKCSFEFQVRMDFMPDGPSDYYKFFTGSTLEITERIDKYLERNTLKNGELSLPYIAKEDIECYFTFTPIGIFTSNMLGQYFGLRYFPVKVKLKKGKLSIIKFPDIDNNTFSQYYFIGDYIKIANDEICWKNCTFNRITDYPSEINEFF